MGTQQDFLWTATFAGIRFSINSLHLIWAEREFEKLRLSQ